MPSLLANCSWDGDHDAGWIPGSRNITRPGAQKCSQSMYYGGVTMPPAIWDDWYHLVRSLVEHAVSRYGVEEIRDHWAFEVWNGKSPETTKFQQVVASVAKCIKSFVCQFPTPLRCVCLCNSIGRTVGNELSGAIYEAIQPQLACGQRCRSAHKDWRTR